MDYTTYYHSPVGVLRIRGTGHYISEIYYLEEVPPGAVIRLNDLLQSCVEQLMEYFQGLRRSFELPVAQAGTDFQQQVWSELAGIPYGRTITYLELSKRIGDTKALRAAAAACGKNHVSIVVPCHRVLGSGGDLGGYSSGVWRKRRLLELENRVAGGVQTLF